MDIGSSELAFEAMPAAGWRRGLETCSETGGVIRAGLPALCPRTPDIGKPSAFGDEAAQSDGVSSATAIGTLEVCRRQVQRHLAAGIKCGSRP
jgi:hypothetical protein